MKPLTPRSNVISRAALAGLLVLPATAHAAAQTYGESIFLPGDAGPALKAVADDAAATLKKMTGQDFKTAGAPPGTGGIRLLRVDDPATPAAIKKGLSGKSGQAYYIRADAKQVLIVGGGDAGLGFGLYFYLDRLGARWFLPGDHWEVIPKRADIRLALDQLNQSPFKNRSYFVTGGYGRPGINRFYDIDDKVPAAWARWQARNGFGVEYTLGGHAGEDFNTRNKAELLKHPEYLAEIGGVHVPWSVGAKPDVSNPGLVELYVKDRVELFGRQLLKYPGTFAITVEPADGGGFCTTGPCTKIGNGSPSDQAYYLANQVAKAVAQKWPGKSVSLLAYSEHILPPSFPLEPNVHIVVVPYGYNYTGLTAEEVIQVWQKQRPELSLNDYFGMPDWTMDLPNTNFIAAPAQKFGFWRDHGVTGFVTQSGASAGSIGLAWYVSSRLMWDPEADTRAIVEDFYEKAFGPAAPPMKRMLERWAGSFLMTDHELACSFRDLQEARRLAGGDDAILSRLDDYGRYTHYMRLWYEFNLNPAKTNTPGPNGTTDALVSYMWNIYDSMMLEPFRMTQLVSFRFRDKPEIMQQYNMADRNLALWKNIRQLTRAEVEQNLADDLAQYRPLDFEMTGYGGELVPLPTALAVNTSGGKPTPMWIAGVTNFELLVPPTMKSAEFSIAAGANFGVPLRLVDAAGRIVFESRVDALKSGHFTLPFARPGRYTLQMKGIRSLSIINIPPGLGWTTRYFTNDQGHPAPRLYFYVPKGLKTLAYHLDYKLVPKLMDADGREVPPRLKNAPGICLYDVPPGQDGRVWSFVDLRIPKPMTLLNAPPAYAVSPDQLLIPKDALSPPVGAGT